MTSDELQAQDTKELHDRAVGHAVRHLDIGFLWRLVESIPAAGAAAGDLDRSRADVMSVAALLSEVTNLDEGPVAEQLRPIYIDYLQNAGKRAD
ncbi:MAG: hypothetical protein M3N53_00285 [Actinomycetota bacterium]|nr:hypothetical protein [Actinomycetota bacterium]